MIKKETTTKTVTKSENVEIEIFTCSDGKTFTCESDAINHESLFEKIKNIPYSYGGYYCRTKDELIDVAIYNNKTNGYRYYNGYDGGWDITGKCFDKPDWYIFRWEENCDRRDFYGIDTSNKLIEEAEDELNDLKNKYYLIEE